jgi:hypothetical protein
MAIPQKDAQSAFGTALVRSLLDRQPESAVLALCTSQPDGPANTRLASLGSLAAKVGRGRLAIVVVPSSSSIEAANANADADELRVAVGEVDFVSRFGVDMLVLGAAAGLDVCSSCDTATNLSVLHRLCSPHLPTKSRPCCSADGQNGFAVTSPSLSLTSASSCTGRPGPSSSCSRSSATASRSGSSA